jgi:hypothetical protein
MSTRGVRLGVVLLVAVVISLPVAAQTITLQQALNGYTGTSDAWLEQSSPRANYGGSQDLHMRYNSGSSDSTVMKFDLAGQIPANQRIKSATLEIYYTQATNMATNNALTIKPFRINAGMAWYENVYTGTSGHGVSWDYRNDAQTLAWTGTLHGAWSDSTEDSNGTNKIKPTGGTVADAIAPLNWVGFDVKNSVAQWYGGAENNGLVMGGVSLQGTSNVVTGIFASRNSSTASQRPKLTVAYEGALLPIANPGGPYKVFANGPAINLDGTGSNDPDGGSIVSYLWDLDNDGQYDDATGATPSVSYDYLLHTLGLMPGDHTIGLKVFDDEGDSQVGPSTLTVVPEPTTLLLLLVGGTLALLRGRRK